MKKNMEMVGSDEQTLQFVLSRLRQAPSDLQSAGELAQGFADLLDGISSALTITSEENGRSAVDPTVIRCGDLTVCAAARKVMRGDEEIYLTPKEFDILYFLAGNRGEVFTKEQIYKAVWEDDYLLDDSNIMAFIRKLRKKIEKNPDSPEYILTIWGIGYKFNDRI